MLKCISFLACLGLVAAAGLPYLPRHLHVNSLKAQPQQMGITQKEFYFYNAPETPRKQTRAIAANNNHSTGATSHLKPEAKLAKYRTVDEVIEAIVKQYGGKVSDVQHLSAAAPSFDTISSNTNSIANVRNIEPAAATYAAASNIHPNAIPAPNTPVHKNYAQNFLPTGVDVIPGSSYIPLVL